MTLIELLVTMAILLIVLTTITDALVSGTNAETSARNRLQVQSDARLALSKMRDDMHCAFATQIVTANTSGGYSIAFTEAPRQCKAIDSSSGGSQVYVEWCTVPQNNGLGTYALYRSTSTAQITNGSCNTANSSFELTDIVKPSGGWPGGGAGNLWPTARTCATGHHFLATQPIAIAVNPNPKASPSQLYELDDNIAMRNSTPCRILASTNLTVTAAPSAKTAGQTMNMSELVATLSAGSNPTGTITFYAFTSLPSDCSTGGMTVGTQTASGDASYSPSGTTWPSGGFSVGTYYWYAVYSGDGNNSPRTSTCGAGMPSTTVSAARVTPTITLSAPATGSSGTALTLTATFTSGAGPTGTVSFYYQTSASACPGGLSWVLAGSSSVAGTTATLSYTPTSAATYSWYAAYGGDSGYNAANTCSSIPTTVVSAPPDTFGFSAIGTQTAGTSFNFNITANLAGGGVDTSYTGTKTIVFTGPANSPNGGAPSYPATVSFVNGVGGASVILKNAASTTITATQGAITGTSSSFLVNAGTTQGFNLSTPATQTAAAPFSVTLTAIDAWGNFSAYSGAHTVVWTGASNSPSGAAPTYPASANNLTFTAGTTTASGIQLYNAAASTTLTATEGGTKSGTTGAFAVTALTTVSGLVLSNITTNPSPNVSCSGTIGTSWACTSTGEANNSNLTLVANLSLADQYGNVVTNASGSAITIDMALTGAAGSLAPNGASVLSVANGASQSGAQFTLVRRSGNNNTTGLTATIHGTTKILTVTLKS